METLFTYHLRIWPMAHKKGSKLMHFELPIKIFFATFLSELTSNDVYNIFILSNVTIEILLSLCESKKILSFHAKNLSILRYHAIPILPIELPTKCRDFSRSSIH